MSVVVATAYTDEAERSDWLVAMSAGKVLAAGSPAELKARTGAATVEMRSLRCSRKSSAAVIRRCTYRRVVQASPSTHFVLFAQSILYRGAGIDVVWPQFLFVALIGGLFFGLAIMRFRSVAAQAM
jgi:hypothetical protein